MEEAERDRQLRELGRHWSRFLLQRLYAEDGDPLGEASEPSGACDDCGREVEARWRVGRFACCRPCTTRRLRAGIKLAEEETRERDPNRDPPASGGASTF